MGTKYEILLVKAKVRADGSVDVRKVLGTVRADERHLRPLPANDNEVWGNASVWRELGYE